MESVVKMRAELLDMSPAQLASAALHYVLACSDDKNLDTTLMRIGAREKEEHANL
jgi:hypothetical protein